MPTLNPTDQHILGGDYARRLRQARIQQGIALYKMCLFIRDTQCTLHELCHHFENAGYSQGQAIAQAARVRNFARNDKAYTQLKQAVLSQEDMPVALPSPFRRPKHD